MNKTIEVPTLITLFYAAEFLSCIAYAVLTFQLFVVFIGLGILFTAPFFIVNNLSKEITLKQPFRQAVD